MSQLKFVPGILAITVMSGVLFGCQKAPAPQRKLSAPASTANAVTRPEAPVAPEKNPPGDIPDTQAFVTYKSSQGRYSIESPEGWTRTEHGTDVKFADKFNGEAVAISMSAAVPSASSVQRDIVPVLKKNGRAVEIKGVTTKHMRHGTAVVCVAYTSNSEPDPVTGKKLRLDNVGYFYYHQGKLATLTLWAPSGADNVDQWKRISESFGWY
ncbi:MAG: hypothetical protein ACYC1M_08475 [Armatimonadota bacterium]